ncbi:hypothetical protein OF83DRAFT_851629 [Amylostereum chailletii]|nr:hypothetical protein OF83DRAFT_851629 [Amylostereum chailletii]
MRWRQIPRHHRNMESTDYDAGTHITAVYLPYHMYRQHLSLYRLTTMPKWQDPSVLAADYNALVRFQLVVGGIYIWEFVTTLDYDWAYISGRRSWKWTTLLYEGCRLSVMASMIVISIGFGSPFELNCIVWLKFTLSLCYLGELFSSSLIAIRAHVFPFLSLISNRSPIPNSIAIWNRNIYIVVPAISALLAQLCVLVYCS